MSFVSYVNSTNSSAVKTNDNVANTKSSNPALKAAIKGVRIAAGIALSLVAVPSGVVLGAAVGTVTNSVSKIFSKSSLFELARSPVTGFFKGAFVGALTGIGLSLKVAGVKSSN